MVSAGQKRPRLPGTSRPGRIMPAVHPSPTLWQYFYEIYEVLPRQRPGTRESTLRALGLVPSPGPAAHPRHRLRHGGPH